ncbi:hypothetical protein JCGZ_08253 [Jatropha curcas]|uniref:Uncharacterized protein n=1 Tax=Jatropha curcas TaxID=180498 RepID=A0A067J971_JATCU|nr:hypothetical protein JCGZ_08253 [Jatropha curcas]
MMDIEVGDVKGDIPGPTHCFSHDHHEDSMMVQLHILNNGQKSEISNFGLTVLHGIHIQQQEAASSNPREIQICRQNPIQERFQRKTLIHTYAVRKENRAQGHNLSQIIPRTWG